MLALTLSLLLAGAPPELVLAAPATDGGPVAWDALPASWAEAPDAGLRLRAAADAQGLSLQVESQDTGALALVVELPSPAAVQPQVAWKGVENPLACPGLPLAPELASDAQQPDGPKDAQACELARALPRLGVRRFTIGKRLEPVPDLGTRSGLAPASTSPVIERRAGDHARLELRLARADLPLTTVRELSELRLGLEVGGRRALSVRVRLPQPWRLSPLAQHASADLKDAIFRPAGQAERICTVQVSADFGPVPRLNCFEPTPRPWGQVSGATISFLPRSSVGRPLLLVEGREGLAAWAVLAGQEQRAGGAERLCRYATEDVPMGCFGAGCGEPADMVLERTCVEAGGKVERQRWRVCAELAGPRPEDASLLVELALRPGAPPTLEGSCWATSGSDDDISDLKLALPLRGRPRR